MTSNKFVSELFDLTIDLWNELVQFISDDIIGNRFKESNSEYQFNSEHQSDITKKTKCSELENLDMLRNELIEYFESRDEDDIINLLSSNLQNFTPSLIPELSKQIYTTTPFIDRLIHQYQKPIQNS